MSRSYLDWIWVIILILPFLAGCGTEINSPSAGGCLAEEMVNDYVRINEILAHSDPPYEDAIELFNPSLRAVCLEGWYLSDDKEELQKYQIPVGTRIGPGEYLVFYAQQFNAQPGEAGSFGLSEYGEDIYLTAVDERGQPTGYRDGGSFPASATNQALGHIMANDGLFFANLQQPTFGVENPDSVAEFRQGGGAANAPLLVGPLVISAIQYDPADEESEYLALTNISDQPVRLYHPDYPPFTWQFTDGIQYAFPAQTNVAPGQTILVVELDPEEFRAQNQVPPEIPIFGPYEGRLRNEGERITLSRPDKIDLAEGYLPYVVVDSLAYGIEAPWPAVKAGSGTPIERLNLSASGDDATNWRLGDAGVFSKGEDTWLYKYSDPYSPKIKEGPEDANGDPIDSPTYELLNIKPFQECKRGCDPQPGEAAFAALLDENINMEGMLTFGAVSAFHISPDDLFSKGKNFYFVDYSDPTLKREYVEWDLDAAFSGREVSADIYNVGDRKFGAYEDWIIDNPTLNAQYSEIMQELIDEDGPFTAARFNSDLAAFESLLAADLARDPYNTLGDGVPEYFADLRAWLGSRIFNVQGQLPTGPVGPPGEDDPIFVSALSGSSATAPKRRWSATAVITVSPLENGAEVTGSWSSGGSDSCVTSAGVCSISKNNLKSNISSVTFTVDNIVQDGFYYDAASNAVDSVQISRP